jgi:hypothetical protein
MLIKDTEQLQTDSFFKQVETDNQRILDSLRQYENAVLLGKDNDPTSVVSQMGNCLSSTDVKNKLEQLSYYVQVERHPQKPNIWVVYNTRLNPKKYIAAFEEGIVPERTLLNTRTITDVDPDSLNPSWTPKKMDAPRVDINGIIQIDEGEKPGLTKYTIPWNVAKMGYRTILIRLIQSGLVSLTRVEEVFSSDNTPEWASKTGKRKDVKARI